MGQYSQRTKTILNTLAWAWIVGLGCVLISSGLSKIRNPPAFLSAVYSYELLQPQYALIVSMTLPWLELIVGICLVANLFKLGALQLGLILCGLFVFVQASALYRGLSISCGCFAAPADSGSISYNSLIQVSAMLLGTVLVFTWSAIGSVGERPIATMAGLNPRS